MRENFTLIEKTTQDSTHEFFQHPTLAYRVIEVYRSKWNDILTYEHYTVLHDEECQYELSIHYSTADGSATCYVCDDGEDEEEITREEFDKLLEEMWHRGL